MKTYLKVVIFYPIKKENFECKTIYKKFIWIEKNLFSLFIHIFLFTDLLITFRHHYYAKLMSLTAQFLPIFQFLFTTLMPLLALMFLHLNIPWSSSSSFQSFWIFIVRNFYLIIYLSTFLFFQFTFKFIFYIFIDIFSYFSCFFLNIKSKFSNSRFQSFQIVIIQNDNIHSIFILQFKNIVARSLGDIDGFFIINS